MFCSFVVVAALTCLVVYGLLPKRPTLMIVALGAALMVGQGAIAQDAQNLPAPGPQNQAELIQNAALFFKTAQTTCAAVSQSLELIRGGVYLQGIKDGAIGIGVLALIAYLVLIRQERAAKPPA